MKFQAPITDDDIEAYLSDRLDPARRRAVESWLADHPVIEAEVLLMHEQQEALRLIGQEILEEPLPDRFLALLDEEDDPAAEGGGSESGGMAGCGAGR